jgi:hypothetical protein
MTGWAPLAPYMALYLRAREMLTATGIPPSSARLSDGARRWLLTTCYFIQWSTRRIRTPQFHLKEFQLSTVGYDSALYQGSGRANKDAAGTLAFSELRHEYGWAQYGVLRHEISMPVVLITVS